LAGFNAKKLSKKWRANALLRGGLRGQEIDSREREEPGVVENAAQQN